VVSWPVVWFWFLFYKDYISEPRRNFAKWKYFAVAVLSGLGNLMTSLPASYVSGPVQVILSQVLYWLLGLIWYHHMTTVCYGYQFFF